MMRKLFRAINSPAKNG